MRFRGLKALNDSYRATEHVGMASLRLPRAEIDRLLTDSFDTPPSPFAVPTEIGSFAGSSTRQAKAATRSAVPSTRRGGASDGSRPARANSIGRASPTARPSSPAAAASWSATTCRFSSAAPAAAIGSPDCKRSRSATAALRSTGPMATQPRHLHRLLAFLDRRRVPRQALRTGGATTRRRTASAGREPPVGAGAKEHQFCRFDGQQSRWRRGGTKTLQ